ncbi:hypothetical protein CARUB_v10016792mg [Capsella rubella]|uniref:Serine aminopeptidase S33 domain-containing protein n=1 Tax=Capsella rubella TaxID=81985 RepID=R0HEW3_9BRAS|nr:hypothetical protein CARUB_v10016792mg [Capsella rubella]
METTTLLRSSFGLCAVSSLSYLRQRTSASKRRLISVKSITSTTPPPSTSVRLERKDNDEKGATVAEKVVANPYSNVETARPELRKSLSDFLEEARELVVDGSGPPRWFSPLECGAQAQTQGSPLLLFIPGIDGTGLGLISHHKKLGEVFDIWCLHIPVSDRTPAKDLVKLIEKTVKLEHSRFPNRPIYLVGESIGACLALDVAARNPNIDLSLIMVNPATHINNFISQLLSGMLSVLPDGIPTLLEDIFGVKQGALSNEFSSERMGRVGGGMLRDLLAVLTNLPTLGRMFSKDTLLWKLEMLKSAVASANSHIYSVRAETIILLSGRFQWLLNKEYIDRYSRTFPKCIVRKLDSNGQFPLMEDGVDLANIIKATSFYRRGKSHDHISDYIMPTPYELKQQMDNDRWLVDGASPVMLSTREDGTLVRSLEGLPLEGPVLYVGNHMLLAFDMIPMISQILKERNIHLRGLAHPMFFLNLDDTILDTKMLDKYKIMGGVPVSNFSIYKLLREKAHVLLYPGGVREALHRKGEEHKLFWPERSEFVRVASKFGAKIIPFGVVGVDDICKFILDSNDQRKIPILKDIVKTATRIAGNIREGDESELGKQDIEKELKDKEKAQELYLQVKSEVEQCVAYLKVKRESDPYRHLLPRMMYQASHGWSSEIPTFDL